MRRRILKSFVQALAAAIAVTLTLTVLLTYNLFSYHMRDDLRSDSRMICRLLENGGREQIEAFAEHVRVTQITPDGTVLFDNEADASQMDSHIDRPEIVKAMEHGEGFSTRRSDTMERSTFYYAVRLQDGSVLRVARQAQSIISLLLKAAPLLLLLFIGTLGMSFFLANMLTRRIVYPIEGMADELESTKDAAVYPELQPFIRMIDQQHEEIIRNANMRVEFTANVSHELKTPLTSISGYAELIESGMAQGEMVKRFAGEINKSANRLLTLINDIIRLSQMDTPEHTADMEPVSLDKAAESVVEQLRINARRMHVDLLLDASPAVVSADKGMMEELIFNLCDNAIRYNVSGGSVLVRVRPERDKVLLVVQDTGIGISEEHRERVFERFYRVDKSRSKATGGTGLGLAIVKHIAVKHNAQIAVTSELGKGTTITVTFERYL